MSCAPCCSRLPFRLVIGLSAFTLPPTSSTFCPPRPSQPPPPTSLFSTPLLRPHTGLRVRLLPEHLCHCFPQARPSLLLVCLGYSKHKGYQCLDLNTNHLLVSRHIVFDESSFPFASSSTPPDDLDSLFLSSPAVCPIALTYPSSIAGTSEPDVTPRAAPAPQPAPRVASA
jgi:hypothetical protein